MRFAGMASLLKIYFLPPGSPQLLRTNKNIRKDAQGVFYGEAAIILIQSPEKLTYLLWISHCRSMLDCSPGRQSCHNLRSCVVLHISTGNGIAAYLTGDPGKSLSHIIRTTMFHLPQRIKNSGSVDIFHGHGAKCRKNLILQKLLIPFLFIEAPLFEPFPTYPLEGQNGFPFLSLCVDFQMLLLFLRESLRPVSFWLPA